MQNITYYLLVILVCLGGQSISQNIDDFKFLGEYYDEELYLGFAVSNSYVSNTEAPHPDHHKISGFSAEVNMRYIRLRAGEVSWRWQHKLVGDVALLAHQAFTKDSKVVNRNESSGISCGLLGWWNWTMNLRDAKRHVISLGINVNDYFLGASYQTDTMPNPNELVSLEPQGYYFAAGPTVNAQFQVSPFLLVESSVSYSIPFWRAVSLDYAIKDDDYPNPHFGQINAEAITKWGLYLAINYNWLINRGDLPNNIKRFDLLFGFRFRV